ncbi:MAG TPA: DNA translocase FtsK [bacterium]|nr:DNA translocase FtsK [bacterium]
MQEEKNSQKWQFPSIEILDEPVFSNDKPQDTEKNSKTIVETLKSFNIVTEIDKVKINIGQTYTRYQLNLKSATDISKIKELGGNLALAVASINGTIRIDAPIPGKDTLGIEIPNDIRQKVYFKTAIKNLTEKEPDSGLIFPLGLDVEYNLINTDIKKWPNILIAGSTGSGKSIFLHNIILSMLFTKTPDEVKLVLIDPKRVEFSHYKDIPYLLKPVINDMNEAVRILSWLIKEAKRREGILSKANVETNTEYNKKVGKTELPDILVINDTMEEIMEIDAVKTEAKIIKIAKISQKVGIHQIFATSRPYASVFTGLIRENITTRAAFQTLNQISSRVTIDQPGAEKLLGNGDMLFLPSDSMNPLRLQGSYISLKETERVVGFVKKQATDLKNSG